MDADEFKDTARKERRITELERQVTMMSKTKSKLGSFQTLKRMRSKEKLTVVMVRIMKNEMQHLHHRRHHHHLHHHHNKNIPEGRAVVFFVKLF